MDVNNLRHPSAFLKMVELVILIIIMLCYFTQYQIAWQNFASSVFVGCFINSIVLLVLRFMGYNQIQNTPLELILYGFYVFSFFVTAILLFCSGSGSWVVAGVFCLFMMGPCCADWYYAFLNLNGYPPQFFLRGQTPNQQTPSSESYQNGGGGNPGDFSAQRGYQQQSSDGIHSGLPRDENIFQINPVYPPTMNYPPNLRDVYPPPIDAKPAVPNEPQP